MLFLGGNHPSYGSYPNAPGLIMKDEIHDNVARKYIRCHVTALDVSTCHSIIKTSPFILHANSDIQIEVGTTEDHCEY